MLRCSIIATWFAGQSVWTTSLCRYTRRWRPSSDSIRSYWFGPSQKWAMRALATLPPPLTTKVPWKLCPLAALVDAQQPGPHFARRGRRRRGDGLAARRRSVGHPGARERQEGGGAKQHGADARQRAAESTVALRRNADGTPSADVPANCLWASR